MNILFLHNNFPAQFAHLAPVLASDPDNTVVFGTTRKEKEIPGVRKVIHEAARDIHEETHHYLRPMERAVLHGQAVYRICHELKSEGFVPDVVYGHSGWGPPSFIKDVFPDAKLLAYFEWFYWSRDSDVDFDPNFPTTPDDVARLRWKNAPILMDLESCDRGMSPTRCQWSQFPEEWRNKIDVIHDGVDTEHCKPNPGVGLSLPEHGIELPAGTEIMTSCAWGMEPQRGFPQIMRAIKLLQKRRPEMHFVIVGAERVAYGKQRDDERSWKDVMLEELDLDLSRVHFTGMIPHHDLVQVLQASSAHVYLTRPFVLSWSQIDALACGCYCIGSRTSPIEEVIHHDENGVLVDFFSPHEIADRVVEAVEDKEKAKRIRQNARDFAVENYSLRKLLPKHLQWVVSGGDSMKATPALIEAAEKSVSAASLKIDVT